jgi:hypothetical protein
LIEEILKKYKIEFVVKTVVAKAITVFPVFGWPIVGPWLTAKLTELVTALYEDFKRYMKNLLVDMDAKIRDKAYSEVKEELKNTLKEKGIDSDEVKKIEEEFDRRLGDLIKLPRVR